MATSYNLRSMAIHCALHTWWILSLLSLAVNAREKTVSSDRETQIRRDDVVAVAQHMLETIPFFPEERSELQKYILKGLSERRQRNVLHWLLEKGLTPELRNELRTIQNIGTWEGMERERIRKDRIRVTKAFRDSNWDFFEGDLSTEEKNELDRQLAEVSTVRPLDESKVKNPLYDRDLEELSRVLRKRCAISLLTCSANAESRRILKDLINNIAEGPLNLAQKRYFRVCVEVYLKIGNFKLDNFLESLVLDPEITTDYRFQVCEILMGLHNRDPKKPSLAISDYESPFGPDEPLSQEIKRSYMALFKQMVKRHELFAEYPEIDGRFKTLSEFIKRPDGPFSFYPALFRVYMNDSLPLAKHLLQRGADVNEKDSTGTSLLIATIARGFPDAVPLFLEHGADVNSQTGPLKQTALHWAVLQGYPQTAKQLLEHGAEVNAKDINGRTALDFAIGYDDPAMAELLEGYGAKQGVPNWKPQRERPMLKRIRIEAEKEKMEKN